MVKERGADGEWKQVGADVLKAPELDPELRIFGRSAADDKGPILIFLAAFDAMKTAGAEPAMHVKVVLDSEEERNSPNLSAVVTAHKDLFIADALVVHDGPMHESGRPTLIFGNRGLVTATLTVFGPRADLHSGKFGNYAPNPAQRLAALLASMKDDDGRVTIPGYYDGVEFSQSEREILAEAGDDESAIRRQLGIASNEPVGASYQESTSTRR